jgi:uncharacterized protein YceH (UPF0502 family)
MTPQRRDVVAKITAVDAVLKNPKLSATQALLLIGLIIRANAAYEDAEASAARLAVYAKVSKLHTVFEALRELERHGLIARENRPGRANAYRVISQRVMDAIVTAYEETSTSERHGNPSG